MDRVLNNGLVRCLGQWRDDRSGGIAIIFALTLTILMGFVGGAIDVGRWMSAGTDTRNAMDGAVLAAGRVMQIPDKTQADALAAAERYYELSKSKLIDSGTVTFALTDSGTGIKATSSAKLKTPFLAVIGVPELAINGMSKAMLQVGANAGTHVEVSMMLDVTGSMEGQKLADLKLAAKDLIDIVVWPDQSTYTSKVALAPFSVYVNVGRNVYRTATGENLGGPPSKSACVSERDTADRYTDAAPSSGNTFGAGPTGSDCNPTAKLMPLTNDKTALKDAIDDFSAAGGTAGHLGTAWAWYTLSPNWASVWPNASEPRPYAQLTQVGPKGNPVLRKIAVLMTDGEYNRKYSGASATEQARAICANMKAAGIQVYTIGFAIEAGGEADTTLLGCATDASHYYKAGDGNELRLAFRDIALKIATLKLVE